MKRIAITMRDVGLCCALLTSLTIPANAATFTVETGLHRLWDLSGMPELRPEKMRMTSSGAFSPKAKDGAEFLYRETNGEYVLFDSSGPGCLVRFWSALVKVPTRLRIYLDGNTAPDVDMEFMDMFSGERFPWVHPITGNDKTSSGGFYSYFPIPYAKACKVTIDILPSFFHIQSLNLPNYDEVETFSLEKVDKYRDAIEITSQKLDTLGIRELGATKIVTLAPGATAALVDAKGPGVVKAVRFKMEPSDPAALREVLLRAVWDGQANPSVWSPVGDFFVNGHEKVDFTSLPIGSTAEGFYCYFPMPFAQSGRLELVNEGDRPVQIEFAVDVEKLAAFPEDWGRFHARWQRVETEMGEYLKLLDTVGRGKFVGVSYNAQAISPWMLEGDEVVWADDELMPSIHGTGTEDYFSGAWYFKGGPFDLATHGAPLLNLEKTGVRSRVSLYRFHTLDPFSFEKRIRVCIEHGQERSMQGSDYCITSFWYQEEPDAKAFPMPAAEDRLQDACRLTKYLPRFAKWEKSLADKNDQATADLGRKLLADFPGEANANLVRFETGQALARLGKKDEAVAVWRTVEDYDGIDFRETPLCRVETWIAEGAQGRAPKEMVDVTRFKTPQKPGSFDASLWARVLPATDFHPNFPNAYLDWPADVQTEVRLGYDDNNLLVHASCFEPDISNVKIAKQQQAAMNAAEDLLVIGLDVDRQYGEHILVSVNANGSTKAVRTEHAIQVLYGQIPMDLDLGVKAAVRREKDRWVVEMTIPRDKIGIASSVRDRIIGLGIFRVRNAGQEPREITMWGSGMIPVHCREFSLARFFEQR